MLSKIIFLYNIFNFYIYFKNTTKLHFFYFVVHKCIGRDKSRLSYICKAKITEQK